jgi:hypothetical protein
VLPSLDASTVQQAVLKSNTANSASTGMLAEVLPEDKKGEVRAAG